MAPTLLDAPYRLFPEHLDAFRERDYVRRPRILDPETLRMEDSARLIPPARAEHHAGRDAFLPRLAPGVAAPPSSPLLFHENREG
ncbi:hypothetical protein [Rhodocaloribacter sp.]